MGGGSLLGEGGGDKGKHVCFKWRSSKKWRGRGGSILSQNGMSPDMSQKKAFVVPHHGIKLNLIS